MEVTIGAVSELICPIGTRLTSRSHLLLQVLHGAQLCKQGWDSFSSHLSGAAVQSRDPGLVMGLTDSITLLPASSTLWIRHLFLKIIVVGRVSKTLNWPFTWWSPKEVKGLLTLVKKTEQI